MKLKYIMKWIFLITLLTTALTGAVFSFVENFEESVKACNHVYAKAKKMPDLNVAYNEFNESTFERYSILASGQPFSKYNGDEKMVEGKVEHRYLGNSAYIKGQKLYNPYYPDDEIVTKPLHQWTWIENGVKFNKIYRYFQGSEELKLKYEAALTIALLERFGEYFDESEAANDIEKYFKRAIVLQPMTEYSRGFIQFRHIKDDGSSWYITIVTPTASDERVLNYIKTKEESKSSSNEGRDTNPTNSEDVDLLVAEVKALRYPANSEVKGYVTVENKTNKVITTTLNFDVSTLTNQEKEITLGPEELKMIEFPFKTEGKGSLTMSGEINRSHEIDEIDYGNNKKVETIEIYDVGYISGGCSNGSNKVKWTESDSRLEEKTDADGSVSYSRVYYEFTYEAIINMDVKVYNDSGKKSSKGKSVGSSFTTKSGYGFFLEPVTTVSYRQVSGEWNRSPDHKPSAASKVVLKMPWTIPNKDYRGKKQTPQGNTITFDTVSRNGYTTSFNLPSNPISKKYGYRKAYTFLDLEDGSYDYYVTAYADAPYKNICITFKGTIKIKGTMHDDYRIY